MSERTPDSAEQAARVSAPAPSFEQRVAQLWCLPQHSSKEMDADFAASIIALLESVARERDALNADVVEAARDLLSAHHVNADIGSPTSSATVVNEARAWGVLRAKLDNLDAGEPTP